MSDYWKQYEGKSVPLKELLQWLSDEHEHVTDRGEPVDGWDFPVVNSMALHRWAIAEASDDTYEYAATWLDAYANEETYWEVFESEWGTLEEAREEARHATEVGNKGAKVVRRRKAGGVEDFDV